jgi:dynamin 1-like protein
MDKLIPLINELQKMFATTKVPFSVEMPQIVVIGGQSSGKSSVLESIVGRDFLPRGVNIVTRRPIVIQLVNTPSAQQDWIEFGHKPDVTFVDFVKARDEIIQDTDRVCGNDKNISNVPIICKVFSKNVVDLTLVDLPGLTKIPIGSQPHDIEKKI